MTTVSEITTLKQPSEQGYGPLPPLVEYDEEGAYVDLRWMPVGATVRYELGGRQVVAIKVDNESVDFYYVPTPDEE